MSASSAMAGCRRCGRRQPNPKRQASLVIGQSLVWPACAEPAACDLLDRPDPRGRDRRDFGSKDCQILAWSSPHTPRDSNKSTACSLVPSSTMDNQQREPARMQRTLQKVPIRQLSIFSCCPPHTLNIIHSWRTCTPPQGHSLLPQEQLPLPVAARDSPQGYRNYGVELRPEPQKLPGFR